MVKLTQRFPNFVDYRDPLKIAEVEKAEDLNDIEWIARWVKVPSFLRFSQSDNYIMAELKDGKWAIAVADGPVPGLPKWVHPRQP